MQDAPLFADLADGPDAGSGYWLKTADGIRVRAGLWNRKAPRGTVLLFPGRTEYIEKYGITATDLKSKGYATFTIDWRGQGLADRLIPQRLAGHIRHFRDYQLDVAAMVDAAKNLNLPRPWHVLGHSMGGAIGLRAVCEGLPVASAGFSAPMWGIQFSPVMRGIAWIMSTLGALIGAGGIITPGSIRDPYVLASPFADNILTNDQEMYQRMVYQLKREPRLALGGPTLRWLNQALLEIRYLARQKSPQTPCLTILGTNESIVAPPQIHDRMQRWPNGKFVEIPDGRHETLMDSPQMRGHAISLFSDHFDSHTG